MMKRIKELGDGMLNIFLSEDRKTERYLLLILLTGFLLRLIASLNEGVFPDDAIYSSQSAGIIGADILSTHSHPILYFFLNDFAYNIFGYSVFASRIFTVLFGSLTIIIVYLISLQLFKDKKTALYSGLLAGLSTFLIRMSFSEHSNVTFFFVFAGIYAGLVYLENKNVKYLWLSGVLFGLGALTKYNAPFFVVSFLVFWYLHSRERKYNIFGKDNLWKLIKFLLIIFVFCLPFLSFNYILYKDKGLADFQFTRVLKPENAQQLYGNLAGQDKSFIDSLTHWPNYGQWSLVFRTDWVICILGLAGLFFMVRKKMNYQIKFFLIFLLIPFLLQSAGNALQKHFVFMHLLFAIVGGFGLSNIVERINGKWLKIGLITIIIIAMLANLGTYEGSPNAIFKKSGVSQLKEFIGREVGENELIVLDPRIYTATSFWIATPHNFLQTSQFFEFYRLNQENNITKVPVRVYFIECVVDDCGWGWVKNDQNFNNSVEQQFQAIKGITKKVKSIEFAEYPGRNEFWGERRAVEEFAIYSAEIPLSIGAIKQTREFQNFYFAPYMYENMRNYIYNYDRTGINGILHKMSKTVIWISLLFALCSIVLPFWMLGKRKD